MLPLTQGRSVAGSAFVAALLSVPVAALAFVVPLRHRRHRPTCRSRTVATAMVGVHVLIGIGEAVITALTVGARPRRPAGPGPRRSRDRLPKVELRSRATPASGGGELGHAEVDA